MNKEINKMDIKYRMSLHSNICLHQRSVSRHYGGANFSLIRWLQFVRHLKSVRIKISYHNNKNFTGIVYDICVLFFYFHK